MSWGSQYDAARDAWIVASTALTAEALHAAPPASAISVARESAGDLALYVGLAVFGSVWRAAWKARDGKMPRRGLLIRAIVVSLGVGLASGLLLLDRDWSPALKMAVVLLASFGADWVVPLFQESLRERARSYLGLALPQPRKEDVDGR